MAKKTQRLNALKSLQEDMNALDDVRTNVQTPETTLKEAKAEKGKEKPKSRRVSNIPWYPKTKALKRELKLIAVHEESSLTALIDEGIAMVLKKRGKDIKDYL